MGRPIVHQSAYKQATGEAVYCDDMRPLGGELHLALTYSTRAHAKLLAVDATAALALAGVHGFISALDIPAGANCFGPIVKDEEVFASKEVRAPNHQVHSQTLGSGRVKKGHQYLWYLNPGPQCENGFWHRFSP